MSRSIDKKNTNKKNIITVLKSRLLRDIVSMNESTRENIDESTRENIDEKNSVVILKSRLLRDIISSLSDLGFSFIS